MKAEYIEWISTWLKTNDPYGKCDEATDAMKLAFPELIKVRGHYFDAVWGEREHWWLKTEDDTIVDPTAKQFPLGGMTDFYEEWEEGREEPVGKCMNCGDYVFAARGVGDCACSQECYKELIRSLYE